MEDFLVNPVKMYLPRLWVGYNRNKCLLHASKRNNWPVEGKVLYRKEWEGGKDLQNLGREVGILETIKRQKKRFYLAQSFAHN